VTSAKKIEANRSNARRSTGPKTALGKAHAAQNARRHGLSVSVVRDPALLEQVDLLAKEIAGDTAGCEIHEHAWRFAEAQVDVVRIHRARHDLAAPNFGKPECADDALRQECPREVADILGHVSKQLVLMARYERRARSRRKSAIRALDLARRSAENPVQKVSILAERSQNI
jgi:integrase